MSGFGGFGGFGGMGSGIGGSANQQQQEQMRLMELMQEMQVADSLRMYNELVLRCFGQCVDTFRGRKLDSKEVSIFHFLTCLLVFWVDALVVSTLFMLLTMATLSLLCQESCIEKCTEKFLRFTYRATQRFQEHQQEMAEAAQKQQ